jgi:hypothetical protein
MKKFLPTIIFTVWLSLLWIFVATGSAGVLILLEAWNDKTGERTYIEMFCEDGISEYDNFDEVDAVLANPEWTKFDKTCTTNCETWRGWFVGKYRCIEIHNPNKNI